MRTIWKYALTGRYSVLQLPDACLMRHIAVVAGVVTLWIELENDAPTAAVQVQAIRTGDPIPSSYTYEYVGTALFDDGRHVRHIYIERRLQLPPHWS